VLRGSLEFLRLNGQIDANIHVAGDKRWLAILPFRGVGMNPISGRTLSPAHPLRGYTECTSVTATALMTAARMVMPPAAVVCINVAASLVVPS
jgi:hypothetical protein